MAQSTLAHGAALGSPDGSYNSFGMATVPDISYSDKDNTITTKIYHGVSIVAGSGKQGSGSTIIGRIQSWQPDAYTREGVHVYELSSLQWGRPVDYVPGKITGFTIAITRAEVWGGEMERAFDSASNPSSGRPLYDDLMDQTRGFTVSEWWFQGANDYTCWDYYGCWFQNKNMEAITADGDGVTKISATLAFVSRRQVGATLGANQFNK